MVILSILVDPNECMPTVNVTRPAVNRSPVAAFGHSGHGRIPVLILDIRTPEENTVRSTVEFESSRIGQENGRDSAP